MSERQIIQRLARVVMDKHVTPALATIQSVGTTYTKNVADWLAAHVILPAAAGVLGHVKPDGTTTTVDVDGTIHAAGGASVTGTAPISVSGGAVSIAAATGSTPGSLSAADKTKLDQLVIAVAKALTINGTLTITPTADGYTLTIPATGTAALRAASGPAANRVAYFSDVNTVTGNTAFQVDPTNGKLGIGISPLDYLHIYAQIPAIRYSFPNNGDAYAQFLFSTYFSGTEILTWAFGVIGPNYSYGDADQNSFYFTQGASKDGTAQYKTVMQFCNNRSVVIGKVFPPTGLGEFDFNVAGKIVADKQIELLETTVTTPISVDNIAIYAKANGSGNGLWLRYRNASGVLTDVKLGGV